jgi:pyridoxamine 5'-phosphate oxidase
VDENPFVQFDIWFQEACQIMPAKLVNAMTLSTVSSNNHPSSRIVLLKEYTAEGFIFYTNYQSRKGIEIEQNPSVSLLFWWEALERQVRIEGEVQKLSEEQSQYYFQTRPKSSQIAALISRQSQPLENFEQFQEEFKRLSSEYADAEKIIHRPTHWGGYLVQPQRFEYWQGRESRLHDRFEYQRLKSNQWKISRLFP